MILYEEVVKITRDYLGPAAPRFIDRQVYFHLNKPLKELKTGDMPKLTEWIKVSLAVLTEDRNMVDECVNRLKKLAKLQ